MRLKYFLILIIFFLTIPAFSQSEIKIFCKFYVDSAEVNHSKPEFIFIVNHNRHEILTDKKGAYFLMDTNLLESKTIDIELTFEGWMLNFKGISNWLKNYDISIWLFPGINFQKSDDTGKRSKYKYFMRLEPRLTDEMIKAVINNGQPYNTFKTKDYYVY